MLVECHGPDHDVVGAPDLGAELAAVAARAPVPHQDGVDRSQDYVATVRVDLERRSLKNDTQILTSYCEKRILQRGQITYPISVEQLVL